jgi:hypothetical protein
MLDLTLQLFESSNLILPLLQVGELVVSDFFNTLERYFCLFCSLVHSMPFLANTYHIIQNNPFLAALLHRKHPRQELLFYYFEQLPMT